MRVKRIAEINLKWRWWRRTVLSKEKDFKIVFKCSKISIKFRLDFYWFTIPSLTHRVYHHWTINKQASISWDFSWNGRNISIAQNYSESHTLLSKWSQFFWKHKDSSKSRSKMAKTGLVWQVFQEFTVRNMNLEYLIILRPQISSTQVLWNEKSGAGMLHIVTYGM